MLIIKMHGKVGAKGLKDVYIEKYLLIFKKRNLHIINTVYDHDAYIYIHTYNHMLHNDS